MDLLFAWLRSAVASIEKRIDTWWKDEPLMTSAELSETTDRLKRETSRKIFDALGDGGDA